MSINREFNTLKFDIVDTIGYLTINRPEKLNALNSEVLHELKNLFDGIKEDNLETVRGLIMTGEGEKAFIAGADIAEMSDMSVEDAYKFGFFGQSVTLSMEELPIPVVACVNGFALGGGCEMAMAADFMIASHNAVFGQPEVKLGLIPGFGGTQRLSRLIGRNKAKEIVYSGRNIKAEEAKGLGLILEIYPDKEEMLNAAKSMLQGFFKNSPKAIALSKKAMNEGNDLSVADGLSKELDQFSAIFSSEDAKEGTKAFLEKRAPNFTGK